jgi:hypothetical protein
MIPMRTRPLRGFLTILVALLSGCHGSLVSDQYAPELPGNIDSEFLVVPEEETLHLPNPSSFAPANSENFWNALVDIVSDYFRIQQEQRVQNIGGQWIEGRIETFPQTGATYLEPWRWDSASRYERTLATLQSIRRTAMIRVLPDGHGFLVDVQVYKELEDVPQPEHNRSGVASFRFGETVSQNEPRIAEIGAPGGWIPMGRDPALEQEILARIYERMNPIPY